MNIPKILETLRPGEQWALSGDKYADLVWLSDTAKPTEKQLKDAWSAIEKQTTIDDVKQNRRLAYIAEADPLFFGWQRGENTETEWLDKVTEIRNRFPLPA